MKILLTTINIKALYLTNHTQRYVMIYIISWKKKKTISTFVVGMLLEMKSVLSSDKTQSMDLNKLISHLNNFKNTFTPLEKERNLNLNEPSSCSLKLNTKRIQSQYKIKRKKYKSNSTLIIQKKVSTSGFYSISSHITIGWSLKKGIGTEITCDSLIEYLQKNCPFKIIDSE